MAELNIRERQAGDVTILDLEGKITIGEGNVALRTAVRKLVREGKKKVLLNLSGVSYMDSSGIGELVSSHTTISREQGQLKMLGLGAEDQGAARHHQAPDRLRHLLHRVRGAQQLQIA